MHLLREFAEALTDLDGRFWRSMRALLLRPGLLSRDYIAGRRARWMSPVSLFLLANVLYFFAPGMSDFDLPLRDHVRGAVVAQFDPAIAALPAERRASIEANAGQLHSRFTEPWVRARLAALVREAPEGSAFAALEQRYAIASANVSKALIVLHVPFMAVVLLLAMAGRGRYFAEHVVVALHYFAFVLFLFELVVLPGAWLAERAGADAAAGIALRYLLPAALGVYGVIAVRVAYDCGWWRATLAGLALPIALLAINLTIYRALQFAVVLALA
nr:DUF3667 domain-containing protein [Chiayiivirga flava]